jgi:hypothetical protein
MPLLISVDTTHSLTHRLRARSGASVHTADSRSQTSKVTTCSRVCVLGARCVYSFTRSHILSTLHHTTPHYTTPHHTTPHHITLHHTTPHHITLHYTTLHYTTPHHTTPHCSPDVEWAPGPAYESHPVLRQYLKSWYFACILIARGRHPTPEKLEHIVFTIVVMFTGTCVCVCVNEKHVNL